MGFGTKQKDHRGRGGREVVGFRIKQKTKGKESGWLWGFRTEQKDKFKKHSGAICLIKQRRERERERERERVKQEK